MKDFKHIEDKEVRELSLMQEEAHYVHTINAFVELIVLYGWDKVIGDLRTAMGEKQW
jgi:adenine/guanine phosphoribosyltransferase-like PRPP-binding protein